MTQTLEAVFENGIFRPLTTVNLSIHEGQPVRLVVEPIEDTTDALKLAQQVYAGLTQPQIDEIEQIALNRKDFFGDRTLN